MCFFCNTPLQAGGVHHNLLIDKRLWLIRGCGIWGKRVVIGDSYGFYWGQSGDFANLLTGSGLGGSIDRINDKRVYYRRAIAQNFR